MTYAATITRYTDAEIADALTANHAAHDQFQHLVAAIWTGYGFDKIDSLDLYYLETIAPELSPVYDLLTDAMAKVPQAKAKAHLARHSSEIAPVAKWNGETKKLQRQIARLQKIAPEA